MVTSWPGANVFAAVIVAVPVSQDTAVMTVVVDVTLMPTVL